MTPHSLPELQEEDERLSIEESVERKKAAIRALRARGMTWRIFSSNGKLVGVDWTRVWQWLKSH